MKEILPLTSLRAFAAFLVFMYHYAHLLSLEARGLTNFPGEWIPLGTLWTQGQVGVSIFFVLSGFLITRIYFDGISTGTTSLRLFFVKRIARIWPLFLVFAVIQHGAALRAGSAHLSDFWVTLSMTQGFFEQLRYDGLPTAWSLTIEESFYVSAPFVFLILARIGTPGGLRGANGGWFRLIVGLGSVTVSALAIGLILGTLIPALGWDVRGFMGSRHHVLHSSVFGRFPEFAVGMAAAFIHRSGRLPDVLSGWRATAVTVASSSLILAALYAKAALAGSTIAGAAATTIGLTYAVALLTGCLILGLSVGGGRLHRVLSWGPFAYLGKVSYGFYLIQLTVIIAPLVALTDRLGAARLPALFLLTNLACAVFYEMVERPARVFLIERFGRRG